MNNPKNSLPNGWSLKKLGEIINYKKGFAFKSVDYQQNGVRIVRISDTTSDSIKEDGKIFIDYKKAENYIEYRLEENDIIVATVGSRPPMYDSMVGKAILVRKEFVGSLLNQNAVKLIPIQDYDSRVIYEHLRMPTYIKYIEDLVRGNANQVSITLNDLFAFEIPLPPLPEQQKIATILGTWDAAIQTTSALLTALQKRKKGLMQQLLDTEKNEIKAGTIFQNISQKNYPNEPLLSATQDRGVILRSMLEGRVASPEGSTNGYKLVEIGDFIISLRSFEGGIEYSEYRGIISPAYTILRPKILIYRDYYKHYFKSDRFIKKLGVAVIGIRDGRQVSFDDFSVIKIPFPSLAEQTRIAVILNTADAELRQTEAYLEKLKTQKRGLMQQLLTGKVRVKYK